MLCPFCLNTVTFQRDKPADQRAEVFICPDCKQKIPAQYVREYRQYPPVVVSAVGFRGHGKTVQFASLFLALKDGHYSRHWPSFFTHGVDEKDLDTIYANVSMLRKGVLPDATQKNFPRPTMIRVKGMPGQGNCTWLCFDTGGECFENPRQLGQYAPFVQHARTVMFLISVTELTEPAIEMGKLLNTYISGMGTLGGRTQDQHLVVVFSKADELSRRFNGHWPEISAYLSEGTTDGLSDVHGYVGRMSDISHRLKRFTCETLGAYDFMNAARGSFKSVEFCLVSALGAKPVGRNLEVQVSSKRLLDPMLWLMEKSQPRWRQLLHKWRR